MTATYQEQANTPCGRGPREPINGALYRIRRDLVIVRSLEEVARAYNSERAAFEALLIKKCADPKNIWIAEGLSSSYDPDEAYEGVGHHWSCHSRLCAFCGPDMRKRARARAREAVRGTDWDDPYLKWRFATLTSPKLLGKHLKDVIEVYNRAFELLRKREFWLTRVKRGVKGIEFTLGDVKRIEEEGRDWSFELDGYHVHMHLLLYSEFIEVDEDWQYKMADYAKRRELYPGNLRSEWTYCIRQAWEERGWTGVEINTETGEVGADVRLVRKPDAVHYDMPDETKASVSLEYAVKGVAKYITKHTSWDKVPLDQLLEMVNVERWPRMAELLGEAHGRSGQVKQLNPEPVLLDTEPLLDGEGIKETGAAIFDGAEVEMRESGGLRFKVIRMNEGDSWDSVLKGIETRAGPQTETWKKALAPSLRSMLGKVDFEILKKMVDDRVARTQRCRRIMLAKRYPYAVFTEISGDKFYASTDDEGNFKLKIIPLGFDVN